MHTSKRPLVILPLALAPLWVSASCAPPSPATGIGSDSEAIFVRTGCDDWGCGSNTPVVNNDPVGALHLDGAPNAAGFRINPMLYRPDHSVDGYRLDIRLGELIGTNASGGELHGPAQLEGRSFLLTRTHDGSTTTWRITISRAAVVGLFREPGSPPAPPHEYAPVYELVYSDPSVDGQATHLCPEREPWGWQEYQGPNAFGGYPVQPPTAEGQYALLVRGETYDPRTATVVLGASAGSRWFNVACSGTALSKMRLLGYNPEDQRTTPAQRQATLKMLTARYCRAHPELFFTEAGQPLVWQNAAHWFNPELRDVGKIGDIEAVWNADGAICLSKPRRNDVDVTRADVTRDCGATDTPPVCPGTVTIHAVPGYPGAEWVTALRL